MSDNYVGSLYEDQAGVLWIGTRAVMADEKRKNTDVKKTLSDSQADQGGKQEEYFPKTKSELRKILTPIQYEVT